MTQSTVPQRLTKLKYYRMVSYEWKRTEVYYTVGDGDEIGVIKVLEFL
ncbi:hypothetical protein M3Y14_31065 (plasmid) [Bacillus thuringiensis]|nr:hypothetical protein [Bacillus thuringiensis]UYX55722.1 hypothetical protein M3Y14_31065 [Bacillus thuringiensis]